MRLLHYTSDDTLILTEYFTNPPPYAILSHTWGPEEVTFSDITSPTPPLPHTSKLGFKKILFCGEEAKRNNISHFWVDTCCIDKSSSAELSEAINSMYKWYQDAAICYVYLSDISAGEIVDGSRWFTRGWTLQELLAPKEMSFFDNEGKEIDTRSNLSVTISRTTGIPRRLLYSGAYVEGTYSVAQVLSWAAKRETTREEDIAYCLLGLLGINMPLLYGEGKRAFERLQMEFVKISTDHSLLCWAGAGSERGPFAASPKEFAHCGSIGVGMALSLEFEMTNRGLRIDLPLIDVEDGNVAAVLDCEGPGEDRVAVYLREARPGMYRRVRCEELYAINISKVIPKPKTIHIESVGSRLFSRDQSSIQEGEYAFRVDFADILRRGFVCAQHQNPDDGFLRSSGKTTRDFLDLTVDRSGQYIGLLFTSKDGSEQFVVIIGVHNYEFWLDVTEIGKDETFQSVVEEYYHYSKAHDGGNDKCRCEAPWNSVDDIMRPLSFGRSVRASITREESERKFSVAVVVQEN